MGHSLVTRGMGKDSHLVTRGFGGLLAIIAPIVDVAVALPATIQRRTSLFVRIVIDRQTQPLIYRYLNIGRFNEKPILATLNIKKFSNLITDLVIRRFNIKTIGKKIGLKTSITSSTIKTNVD